ncbi:porin [Nonlabens agnitus]|uniref:Porin n=1 Tax=Nonlabens agnitus TaxID=870484 RepID=A0A2S9WRY3_9FLAO|nr:porin [Nonlabens agnitus]PRP66242.1 porin [Nonlabens agnitus]
MKILQHIIPILFLLLGVVTQAQEVQLNTYSFGEGLRFQTGSGSEFNIKAYLQPAYEIKDYTDEDEIGQLSRFRLRRARLRLDGNSANERFSYRLQVDLSGTSELGDDTTGNYLLDAYVAYDVTRTINIAFGQRSTYTDNRELFMLSNSLQLVERSRLTSAFASIREFGIFAQGRFRTGGGSYLKPYLVVTNGDGSNAFGRDFGGLKVGGRLDFLPFGLFTNFGQFRQADVVRELSPKLVVGVNGSYNSGISSRRGRESGAILYLNDNDEESLPDYSKVGVDFMFKYNGFSVLGEYVKSFATVPTDITQRVRNDGSTSTNFDVNGQQDVENYVKGRMMLGDGFNIQAGYLFKNGISVDGRFTHLNADENSFLNNATFYNRPNYYTLGVSKYLARNYGAKIQASVTYVDGDGINDNQGEAFVNSIGDPRDVNEWIARIQLTLSL